MLPSRVYVGGVPLVVRLSEQDVLHAREAPTPVAFVLPRTTLLLAVVADVLHSFAPYTAALSAHTTQVWFSYDGRHVPWLYTAGAVKDYVTELRHHASRRAHATATTTTAAAANVHDDATMSLLLLPSSSQPLELELRVCQAGKHRAMAHTVPLFVDFAHFDEYVWNEVRQLHKAAYTAIYGAYKWYQNEPEAALRPAVAMALYRPFSDNMCSSSGSFGSSFGSSSSGDDGSSRHVMPPQPSSPLATAAGDDEGATDDSSSAARTHAAAATTTSDTNSSSSSSRGSAVAAAESAATLAMRALTRNRETSSPYLLTEYARLLRDVVARTTRLSYVLQLAYPYAYANADDEDNKTDTTADSSADDADALRFTLRRVRATPLLPPSSPFAITAHDAGAAAAPRQQQQQDDSVTLGVLLWRVYSGPCLRWLQRDTSGDDDTTTTVTTTTTTTRAPHAATCVARTRQRALIASLARFYDPAPADVTADALEQYDVLQSSNSSSSSAAAALPATWAAWERDGVTRFVDAYERGLVAGSADGDASSHTPSPPRHRGIALVDTARPQLQQQQPQRRLVFVVQGTQPSLTTPASFLEAHLASSDRTLYVVVQVR